MRKDFLVDPVQILEGRKAGASGVLLIAALLDDATLRTMLDCAIEHDMFVLLEAFDEHDLRRSSTTTRDSALCRPGGSRAVARWREYSQSYARWTWMRIACKTLRAAATQC